MKPSHLTINTSPSPALPHYKPTTTTTSTTNAHTPSQSRRRKTLLTLLTILSLTTLTLLYFHSPSTTHLPHLTTSLTHPQTLISNPAYNDLSPSADGNWTSLLPPNGGFLSKQIGKKGGDYEMVGLAMFHQLRCLSMIRGALQEQKREMDMLGGMGNVVAGTDRRRSEDAGKDLFGVRKRGENGEDLFGVRRKRSEMGHGGTPDHYLHCFDYLVQVCFVLSNPYEV